MSKFKFKISSILCLFLLILFAMACDSNFEPSNGGSNPNVTAPDNNVAANVGPVEKLVTTDVLNKANSIRNNILSDLDELSGDDTFSGGQELLRFRFQGSEPNEPDDQSPLVGTLDLSQDINCDAGGSRDIIGSATITLNSDRVTGSIIGNYTIQYDNCQEIIVMNTSNGNCSVTPTVDGELPSAINVSFALNSDDVSGQQVNYETSVDTSSSVALDVSVGATASDQSYNFDYSLSSNTTNTNLDGTVSFESQLYDLIELEEFVADSTTSVVCQ